LILKIIFKNKKYYFNIFLNKYFLKKLFSGCSKENSGNGEKDSEEEEIIVKKEGSFLHALPFRVWILDLLKKKQLAGHAQQNRVLSLTYPFLQPRLLHP
jgi:hypothetical protein